MNRFVNLACSSVLVLAGCSGGDETDAGSSATDAQASAPDAAVDAGPEPCESWIIEYDLEGSQFEIRNTPFGAGDAVNTIGPGRIRLRVAGDEGGPQAGEVLVLEYLMEMEFTVAMVETDVTVTSGPEDCGVAMGTRTSSVVAWSTPMAGYHSSGTVTCRASDFLCGAAGLPPNEPEMRESTHDQALEVFVFAGDDDFSNFTMAEVEVPNEDAGDTFLTLTGREITRRCAALPTDCN